MLLFDPGMETLCHSATPDEVTLWERLIMPTARAILLRAGYRRVTLEALLTAGIVAYIEEPATDYRRLHRTE